MAANLIADTAPMMLLQESSEYETDSEEEEEEEERAPIFKPMFVPKYVCFSTALLPRPQTNA